MTPQIEIHTDHIPNRLELIEARKEQLRQSFGHELFDKLYPVTLSYFESHKKHILRHETLK